MKYKPQTGEKKLIIHIKKQRMQRIKIKIQCKAKKPIKKGEKLFFFLKKKSPINFFYLFQ